MAEGIKLKPMTLVWDFLFWTARMTNLWKKLSREMVTLDERLYVSRHLVQCWDNIDENDNCKLEVGVDFLWCFWLSKQKTFVPTFIVWHAKILSGVMTSTKQSWQYHDEICLGWCFTCLWWWYWKMASKVEMNFFQFYPLASIRQEIRPEPGWLAHQVCYLVIYTPPSPPPPQFVEFLCCGCL